MVWTIWTRLVAVDKLAPEADFVPIEQGLVAHFASADIEKFAIVAFENVHPAFFHLAFQREVRKSSLLTGSFPRPTSA